MSLLKLCEGAVLTHLVTRAELDAGALSADDDLRLWARLTELEPLGGVTAEVSADGGLSLAGPAGWLDGLAVGDLAAVRLRDGALTVTALHLDDLPLAERSDAVLRVVEAYGERALAALGTFAEDPATGQGVPIEQVAADLLADAPETFAEPLPPLSILLREASLELSGGRVAIAGAPWDPASVLGLAPADGLRFSLVRSALTTFDKSSDAGVLLGYLARSAPVLARIADEVERTPPATAVIQALTGAAAERDERDERAAALLLAARTAEGEGRSADAAILVDDVLELSPALLPALLDAAEYAACQGRAVPADDLLRRAAGAARAAAAAAEELTWRDAGALALRPALRPLLARPAGETGPNQPCPCDSGLKYKNCHQAELVHPLPVRAGLLYQLLLAYAYRPARRRLITDLVEAGLRVTEPALADLALFEHDVAGEFLETRGEWLRPDEWALVNSWRTTPPRLWEVLAVGEGELTLTDGSGPTVVRDELLATQAVAGDLMLTRLLDDGAGPHIFGHPFKVEPHRGAALLPLLEAPVDPYAIARFFIPSRRP